MKKAYFLLPFIFAASWLNAQILTVVDKDTENPIESVLVSSQNPHVVSSTNGHGQVDMTAFKAISEIEFNMVGYQRVVKSYAQLEAMNWVLPLKISNLSLNQVVVSATRYTQPKSNTPMKISTISQKEVAMQNPQTAADLLAISGEVFIQKSQQGGGSPMIRGFATNRLLMTVDGIRMNTAIFRSGNIQNVISLDPFSIARTEVLFGPNSVIYGSDAIGGVMSFYTLAPKLSLDNNPLITGGALTRYASANNEFSGHFDVNIGWKKLAVLISATHNTYGDLRMGTRGPDDYLRTFYVSRQNNTDNMVENPDPLVQASSGYTQDNMMAKLLYQPSSVWDITYAFHYSTTSDVNRYDRLIRTKNDLPRSAEWYYGPQVWVMNNLKIHNIANNDLFDEFTLRFASQLFEESRIDRDFNDVNRFNRTEKVNALSGNADFVKSINHKNTFFYGAEVISNDVTSTGMLTDISTNTNAAASARYPNSKWYSYAAYVTYQFRLSKKMLMQAGARYNYYTLDADFSNNLAFYPLPFTTSRTENDALTGSLGVDYTPRKDWTISANVSTGFRSPNVDDIGKIFDSEPGMVVLPNPNLGAEYAYNAEFDVAKIFSDFLKLDVAVFYTFLDNALVRRPSDIYGVDSTFYDGELSQIQTMQNGAEAHVYGFEAGLDIDLPAGFSFTSKFSFQKGVEETEDGTLSPLRHAAPWFGLSKLSYSHKKMTLEFYSFYNGGLRFEDMPPSEAEKDYLYAKDENGNPYSPSWYTLNLKMMYKISANFVVTAGLENLTDQRYRPYSSGLAGAGRNLIIAAKINF